LLIAVTLASRTAAPLGSVTVPLKIVETISSSVLQTVFRGSSLFSPETLDSPGSLMFANTKDFDPRVGFAWHPLGSKKTVVRAGAAICHSLLTQNDRVNDEFRAPWGVDQSFQNPVPADSRGKTHHDQYRNAN
jgi:hypothetical protein